MRWVLLVLSASVLAGVAAGAGGDMPDSQQIGPYELERGPESLEIRSRASLGRRGLLAIAAGLCLAVGIALGALTANAVPAALLGGIGLALGAAAALHPPGADRVQLGPTGVVVEGFVGIQGRTGPEEVGSVELQRRKPSGAETKRSPRPRVWQVTVRSRSGDGAVVRFRLARVEEARALASRVGEALDRPVTEREGLAR